jgi:hypothetical protein
LKRWKVEVEAVVEAEILPLRMLIVTMKLINKLARERERGREGEERVRNTIDVRGGGGGGGVGTTGRCVADAILPRERAVRARSAFNPTIIVIK